MGDQRRGGRLAVRAGDGDERAIGRVRPALTHEELDVADHLDAGGAGKTALQWGFGMGERHTGREHQRGDAGPVEIVQVDRSGYPRRRQFSTLAALSSQAVTSAPPAASASAVARPEPPSPKSATVLPLKVVTGIMARSPQLERGQADQAEDDGDDPEADDDLAFRPALLLEMVVDRRHLEDALAVSLNEKTWMMTDSVSMTKRPPMMAMTISCLVATATVPMQAAERQRPGIAHEDRGRRRVEPQEAEAGADHRTAAPPQARPCPGTKWICR
jgi:hypothetical protein